MLLKKREGSIVYKVTWWYSIFIVLLLGLMLGVAYVIGVNLGDTKGQQKLQRSAVEMSQEIEDYENFDDGIYYVIYDKSGKIVRGNTPRGFKAKLGSTNEEFKETTSGQITYQYFDVKIKNTDEWLRAIRIKAGLTREMQTFLLALAVVAPFLVLAIVIGGYRILKKAIAPVDRLNQTAQMITASQDYSKRIVVPKQDNELSRLAVTFNEMLTSIERSFERERQFNNDISHELRTPLAVILAESEYAHKYATNEAELKESAMIINQQALMMKEMVEQMLELTRLEADQVLEVKEFDLSQMLQQQVDAQQKVFEKQNIKLLSDIESGCHYVGDQVLLKRVVDNLLSNALKFAHKEVKVSLVTEGSDHILTVKDDGDGIPLEAQAKVWNKFYQVQGDRNKATNQGVGLGLALVKNIIELHGGVISVSSSLRNGTEFKIRL